MLVMKRRILSLLTSLFLVALVTLALIFVPFDTNSESDASFISESEAQPSDFQQGNASHGDARSEPSYHSLPVMPPVDASQQAAEIA